MASHSSARTREHTPHVNRTTRTATIMNALTRRAQAVLNDKSIDAQSRAIIRYALETHDPWLAELVRRADDGETISNTVDFSQTPETSGDLDQEKIETLTTILCRAGDPKVLANIAKQFVFIRCGELNLNGMVDAQIAVLERELLAGNTFTL